ncbi:hypothetical protein BLA29_009960, partial [Euroglyphus maynei]
MDDDVDESSMLLQIDPSLSEMILQCLPDAPQSTDHPKSLVDNIRKDGASSEIHEKEQKIFVTEEYDEKIANLQQSQLATPKSSPLHLSTENQMSPKTKSLSKTTVERTIIASQRLISLDQDEREIKSVSKKPATLKFA